MDFFGTPRAKSKNIVCEKQLINNYKRSEDFFFLEITIILGKKYGNTRSVQSETFFFRDHHDFIFLEELGHISEIILSKCGSK